MAKLNLKALQSNTSAETKESETPTQMTSQEQLEAQNKLSENTKESDTNDATLEAVEVPTVTITETKSEETGKKKKISLRGISKPTVSEEITPVQVEATAIVAEEITPVQEEATAIIAEEITPALEEATAIIAEEIIPVQEEATAIVAEEITPVQEEAATVVAIMDGDTNCAIIKDDTFEIFGSYKGSFAKEEEKKEEPKKVMEEKKEEIQEVKIAKALTIEEKDIQEDIMTDTISEELTPITASNEEIKNEKQEINEQNEVVTPTITQANDTETTALEKVTEKKKINKKIMYSSLVSVACIGIFGVMFMNNNFMKTSVPDIENIPSENIIVENSTPTENTVVENTEVIDILTPENTTPVIENDNQIENNGIVKENDNNGVDNNDNNRKINKKVENFLLKKYKIK